MTSRIMPNKRAPSRYLIVGHGARETSMARRLSEEGHLLASFSTSSNYGLKLICGKNAYDAPAYDSKRIISFAKSFEADLIIPGNEIPLYNGLSDLAAKEGMRVFGPDTKFCRFEKDKLFSRKFADAVDSKFSISTCGYNSKQAFLDAIRRLSGPYVIKIWNEITQKYSTYKISDIASLRKVDDPTRKAILFAKEQTDPLAPLFILEEFIDGNDFSIYVVTDGHRHFFSPSMHDFPFLKEGETGPKTGGMGCLSGIDTLAPRNGTPEYSLAVEFIEGYLHKAQDAFPKMKGMFSFQFIRSQDGIKFNEIDIRPGDPEMVSFISLLESRFDSLLEGVCNGDLEKGSFSNNATLSAYLVTPDYPMRKDISYYTLDWSGIVTAGCTVDLGPSKRDTALNSLFSSCARAVLLSTQAKTILECSQKLQNALVCEGNDLTNLRYRTDIVIPTPY